MDRLIYTAVSGMADSMIRQGAIASNLIRTWAYEPDEAKP